MKYGDELGMIVWRKMLTKEEMAGSQKVSATRTDFTEHLSSLEAPPKEFPFSEPWLLTLRGE